VATVEFRFLLAVHNPFYSFQTENNKDAANDAMKVAEKKRADSYGQSQIPKSLQGNTISYQIVWYSASLIMYGWFICWIAYDIFVWHKPITQISPTNYAGAIIAMALVWIGNSLFKTHVRVAELPKPQVDLKEKTPRTRKRRIKRPSPQPVVPPPSQPKIELLTEQQTTPEQTEHSKPEVPGCDYYVGYLHEKGREKMLNRCLTCKELIDCLSSSGK
jgi:hypothetical protein